MCPPGGTHGHMQSYKDMMYDYVKYVHIRCVTVIKILHMYIGICIQQFALP